MPEPSVPGGDRLVRVTNEQDGTLLNRGYSYWSQAAVLGDRVALFCGHADGRPRFFTVHPDDRVERHGPLLGYTGTGEGWYWDASGWLFLIDGPRLRRVQPLTGDDHVVLDISHAFPGCDLWQAHSSDQGTTHSATVRRVTSDGPYQKIGTVVLHHGALLFYEARGVLDESAITSDGAYLIIKENDDNRIITLASGDERLLSDAAGALGHSDCGPGYMVGENNQIGACVFLDLATLAARPLFPTWNMGHVSVRAHLGLVSDATHLTLVALDGSGVTRLLAHGMIGSGYDFITGSNLSPCGRVAAFMSNQAGRMDLYLLRL